MTLDLGLASVLRLPFQQLPTVIRRFCEWHGTEDVVCATTQATRRLLEIRPNPEVDAQYVSASKLCDGAGVSLKGKRPRGPQRPYYAVGTPRSKPKGVDGIVLLRKGTSSIRIPNVRDRNRARVTVAHELMHIIMRQRDGVLDPSVASAPRTDEEDAVAEYGARVLLMPSTLGFTASAACNAAENWVRLSGARQVTVYCAAARAGDPDVGNSRMVGAILWRLDGKVHEPSLVAESLTPQWFLGFPGSYVPVANCHARHGSVVANVAAGVGNLSADAGRDTEDVQIGTVSGQFEVEAFAWGALEMGTRLVFSLFSQLS